MRYRLLALILLARAASPEDLDGTITGGKAQQLVEAARGPYQEADAIYKRWILEEIGEADLVPSLKKAIALYDGALNKLQEAIDIQYDPAINHMIRTAARRLTNMRFKIEFQEPRRQEAAPMPEAPPPEPADSPGGDSAPLRPPAPPRPPPKEDVPPPVPTVTFEEQAPPAVPVDVALPLPPGDIATRLAKSQHGAIQQVLKSYYQSRKADSILFRHSLCGGKGKRRDGTVCEECSGSGSRINLFHFRKAYWGAFSPVFRDAAGALEALRAFHARAQRDPAALGDLVKAFSVVSIEPHGYWARATVMETTTAGKAERSYTLISVGSQWFFYHPVADAELVPDFGKEAQ